MPKLKPSLKSTETYTEPNFLRLLSVGGDHSSDPLVTIEHLSYSASATDSKAAGWSCLTIVDSEAMSHSDAVFIAKSYAAENGIPVIYECHAD
ncbi:MAG: hypothetical protein R3305_01985 [Gammaproteobacteria bacterium]|nr:hypothetical protein [Gammaproteobacteria bacterium]